MIDKEEALLVDVRRPKDFEASHVEGAISADKNKVHEILDSEDRARPIICYCYKGVSSRVACKNLKKAGFIKVLNLKGGYDAWKKKAR